ncbi:MAG TPA: entericidin A/B family lipoprotein [Casimicrobiaceae bacterium]|nr:entericidin A/B family lipoprotein [Casimicrobiaceae bacterium]
MRMFTLLVLVALTATMLSACNTVEGFGQDVRAAGRAVERTADDATPG